MKNRIAVEIISLFLTGLIVYVFIYGIKDGIILFFKWTTIGVALVSPLIFFYIILCIAICKKKRSFANEMAMNKKCIVEKNDIYKPIMEMSEKMKTVQNLFNHLEENHCIKEKSEKQIDKKK